MASHPDIPEQVPFVERTTVGVAADVPERMRAALEDLRLLPSPAALAPLVRWTADGPLVLEHQVPAGAVPLSALRAGGPLRAGHVVAAALSAASALAALHDAGLAHGDVGLETMLVAPDGSVVLGATGAAWRDVQGALAGPSAADDVAAVADVIRTLLGHGGAPGPLVLAALRAGDPDPALRPTAGELLDLLARCGAPEPLLAPLWRVDRPAPRDEAPHEPDEPKAAAPAATPLDGRARRREGRPRAAQAPQPTDAGGAGTPQPVSAVPASRAGVPRRPGAAQGRAGRDGAGRAASGRRARESAPRSRTRPILLALLVCAVGALALRAAPVLVAGAASPLGGPPAASSAGTEPLPASAAARAPGAGTVPADAQDSEEVPLAAPEADVDWAAVLAALDAGRRRALASGSSDELARFVDPQGDAWAHDAALLERLASSGARIEGGGIELGEVREEVVDGARARLLVRDRRLAYDVVESGSTTHMAERPWRWWVVTLSPSPSLDGPSWRIADVSGADDRAAP